MVGHFVEVPGLTRFFNYHWHKSYEGAPSDGSAWISGQEDSSQLLRGASWDSYRGVAVRLVAATVPPTTATTTSVFGSFALLRSLLPKRWT